MATLPPASSTVETQASASPSSVQAVAVALSVLEELAKSTEPMGISEIARSLQKTKARVHRHLVTLRELGFVDKSLSGYRIGWKTYRLGLLAAENFSLHRLAYRHMLALKQASGETVALAAPAGADVAVIDALQSDGHVAITIRPGSVIPAATSALGRVILAFQLEPLTGARAEDSRHATPAGADRRRLQQVRRRWHEVAVNERLPGVAALAAPIFDDRNAVIGSVGIIGSGTVVTSPPDARLLRLVQSTAKEISRELGSTAWSLR
jgi:IclR family KDG regulon transcriptional repressor